jgi:hypothetical protein
MSSSISVSGVSIIRQASDLVTQASSNLARQSVDPKVDVPTEMVHLDEAEARTTEGVKVLKTYDEMTKSVLDILA